METMSGMTLRLVADQMQVAATSARFVHRVERQPDADPALTRRVEGVLRAFEQGGRAVEEGRGRMRASSEGFLLADRHLNSSGSDLSLSSPRFDVSDRGIERHGAKVGRILYYQLLTNNAPRHVLVYMTAAGLVTDEDVIGD